MEARMRARAAKKGYMLHFVSPNEYSRYYSKNGIDSFCFECGYEFEGICKEFEIKDKEELDSYRYHKGIQDEINYLTKRHGLFWKIKAYLKHRNGGDKSKVELPTNQSSKTGNIGPQYRKG